MAHRNLKPAIRLIVLPSGRSIEVVRYDERPEVAVRRLHVCPDCDGELVQPHDWSKTPQGRWQITLRCPNCFWEETGLYTREEVERFEEHLEHGIETMIDDLRRLTHANMVTEVERFSAALSHDLILPEDF